MSLPALPIRDGLIAHLDPSSLGLNDGQRVTEAPAVGGYYNWYAQNGGPILRRRKDGTAYLQQTSAGDGLRWAQPAYTNLGAAANGAWVEGYGPIISGEDQVYKGKIWRRSTHVPSTNPITRLRIPGSSLNGQTATASVEVANDTASPVYFTFDFSDNTTGYTLQPGEVRRVTQTGPNNYADYHFSDIETPNPGSVLWREWQVEVGSIANAYTPDSYSPTTDATIFVVGRMRGTANNRIVSGLSNNSLFGWHGNTEDDFYGEGWVRDSATAATPTLKNYAFRRSGSTSSIWSSGVLLTANGNAAQMANGLSTNGHLGGSEFSDSEVYEVIVYERALSDGEIEQVSRYLAEKFFSQSISIAESDGPVVGAIMGPVFSGGATAGRLHVRTARDALNPDYVDEVLASDPIDYRRFTESSGPVLDWSRRNHSPAFSGGTFRRELAGPSRTGSAGYFGGSGASLNLGNHPDFQNTGDQTIEMWLRPDSIASARQNPWDKAYAGEGTITQEPDGSFNYFYGTDGTNGTTYQGFNSGVVLTQGKWHHIVLVRDLLNMRLKWYVNGVKTADAAATYPAAKAGGNNRVLGTGYAGSYIGAIDEVAEYARALSDDEVLRHYRKGKPGGPPQNRAPAFTEWELFGGAYVEPDSGDLILPSNGAYALSPMMEVGTAASWWWSADYQSFSGGSTNFPNAGGIYEQADYYDANGVAASNTATYASNGNAPTWPHGAAFSRETWSYVAGNSIRYMRMQVNSHASYSPNTPIRVRNPQFTTNSTLAFTYIPPTRQILPPPVRTGKVLVIGENWDGLRGTLSSLGYSDVTLDTSASTLADLEGYDLIVDAGAWGAITKPALLAQAYDAGYAILSDGNDSTTASAPFITGFAFQTGFGLNPVPGSTHYVGQGWTGGYTDGDTGNIITSLRSTAVPLATWTRSDGGGTGFTGVLEENPNGLGGRWVHFNNYVSWTYPQVVQRALDWLTSPRPASGEDTLVRTAILVRTASDSAPAEDNKDYIVRGDCEVNLDGVAGYFGAPITRVAGDVYSGSWAAEVGYNTDPGVAAYSQGLIWYTNTDPEGVPAGTMVVSQTAFKGVAGHQYQISGRPHSAAGAYISEGVGYVNFIATGSWQIVETNPYTVAGQAFRPAAQIITTGPNPAAHPFRVDNFVSRSVTHRVVNYRRRPRENDLMRERDTYEWAPGGTTITTGLADPDGGNRAFSVNFNTGQTYAVPFGGAYTAADGLEVGVEYEFSMDVRSADAGNVTFNWSQEGPYTSTDGQGAYPQVTVGPTYTRLTRTFIYNGPAGTYPLLYSIGGVAAGKTVVCYRPTWARRTLDSTARLTTQPRPVGDTTSTSDAVASYAIIKRTGTDAIDTTIGDSATRFTSQPRTTGDDAPAVDDGTRLPITFARSGADSVAGIDSAATRSGQFARTPDDSAEADDATTRYTSQPRTTDDTAEADDSTTQNSFQYRTTGDTAEATDAVTHQALLLRTSTDAAEMFEEAIQNANRWRTPSDDVQGTTDSADRYTFQPRTSDDETTTDDWTDRSGVFVRALDDTAEAADSVFSYATLFRTGDDLVEPETTDFASRYTLQPREVTEVTDLSVEATRWFNGSRDLTDEAPAEDSPFSAALIYRVSDDEVDEVSDDVQRLGVPFVRDPADTAPAVDDGTREPITFARSAEDAIEEPIDSVERLGVPFRRMSPEPLMAPISDMARRVIFLERSAHDTAPMDPWPVSRAKQFRTAEVTIEEPTDEAVQLHTHVRQSADDAPAVDIIFAIDSVTSIFRKGVDEAPATDEVSSYATLYRSSADLLGVPFEGAVRSGDFGRTSQDTLPEPSEFIGRFATLFRRTAEDVLEPDDWAYVKVGNDYRIVPRISILAISRTKMSEVIGYEEAVVSFFFDLPVTAWAVRRDSTTHLDGEPVAYWSAYPPTQYGSVTIPASALRRGSNSLTIYGRSLDGIWTR